MNPYRTRNAEDAVIIGGASGFWGDSSVGPVQLVASGRLHYLVFDYLAELTMSLLAGARLKNPEAGYATDFVTVAMRQVLSDVVQQGIRVVSNAGGVNPAGCAAALKALADELGVQVRIAVVEGDNFMPQWPDYREQASPVDMQSGQPLPAKLVTANAYFGARPIQAALDAGADIVITGRCVDSAVTLGVLMHEFQWQASDYDLLAAGSLAGHIVECGAQATGGLHTDWRSVPDWAHIGYPIIECLADGSFCVTKPERTGGLVSVPVVSEQLVYEIGDPATYILPDVVCDFTQVKLRQLAPNRVQVTGARGRAPTPSYKVSATFFDGFRANAQLTIIGHEAIAKARRTGEAILERTRELFREKGFADYTATRVQVTGAAESLGANQPEPDLFEAQMWLAVRHPQKEALQLFVREVAPAGTSWAPGTTGGGGGRAGVSPSIRHCAFLIPKHLLKPTVTLDGQQIVVPDTIEPAHADTAPIAALNTDTLPPQANWTTVPLRQLAYARSGDKGNHSNIGVIARRTQDLPLLRAQLTPEAVATYFGHWFKGPVERFELPGIHAFNFLCHQALDGGGMSSLRNDPLGKGLGQALLAMPIQLPTDHPLA